MTLVEAAGHWAATINDWYDLDATAEELVEVYNSHFKDRVAYDGTSYAEMFLKDGSGDDTFSRWLDTADREAMADYVEEARGNPPLPTYADLGGNLLNKVRVKK